MDDEDDLPSLSTEQDDGIRPIDITPPPDAVPTEQPLPPFPEEATETEAEPDPDKNTPPSPPGHLVSTGRRNYVKKGDYIDLTEKTPYLSSITVGAGWDHMALEEKPLDVDLSLFLLNRDGQTRIDEDFIFYNNESACDGAIRFLGDSRTGAGDGDDEQIFIDLNGIPFDVMRFVFVLSIYDPEMEGLDFSMIRNIFFRIVNNQDTEEILIHEVAEEDARNGNAMIIGTLIREGPKWIFEVTNEKNNGGLAKFATEYGIIVKELQSTGETG